MRRHARWSITSSTKVCKSRAWITIQPGQILKIRLLHLETSTSLRVLTTCRRNVLSLVQDPKKPLELYEAHNEFLFTRGVMKNVVCRAALPHPRCETSGSSRNNLQLRRRERSYKQKYYPRSLSPTAGANAWLQLKQGDVLIFEEVIGPKTGNSQRCRSHASSCRALTKVTQLEDPLFKSHRRTGKIITDSGGRH